MRLVPEYFSRFALKIFFILLANLFSSFYFHNSLPYSILSCLLPIASLSSLINIECNFQKTNTYFTIKHAYECQVKNVLNITSTDGTSVNSSKGQHHLDKSNDDVVAFNAINKTTNYFPRGLEKFFKNIQVFYIEHGRLKEIHQRDFRPFQELKALYLGNNDIEVLEDGLFEYNVNLEFMSFWGSNIVHIDEGAFRNLEKLAYLWLNYNKCTTKWVSNNLNEVLVLIKELGIACNEVEYSQIDGSLGKLEKSLKTLSHENYQDFSDRFKILEKNFQNSNYSYFLTFNERFDGITNDANYREANDYLKLKNKIETVGFDQKNSKENKTKCENVCYSDVNKFTGDVVDTLKYTFTSFSALSQKVSNFGFTMTDSNVETSDNLKNIHDEIESLQNDVEVIKQNLKILENSTNLIIDHKIGDLRYFDLTTPENANSHEDRLETSSMSSLDQESAHNVNNSETLNPKTYEDRQISTQAPENKATKSQTVSNLNFTRRDYQRRLKTCESKLLDGKCSTDDGNTFRNEIRKSFEDQKNKTKIFEHKMTEKIENLSEKVRGLTEKNEKLSKQNDELNTKVEELMTENKKLRSDNEYFTNKINRYDNDLETLKKDLNDLSQKNSRE